MFLYSRKAFGIGCLGRLPSSASRLTRGLPIAITLLALLCIAAVFSGCTVTFTQNNALQLGISQPTAEVTQLVSEFEAGEENSVAGDVTQKTGSVCAGGACIIY